MAIERSIYASLRVGMKGSPGFQYYSYTNGYKDLILDKNSDIENRFTTFYRAPNGVDTWYLDKETGRRKTPKTNQEANIDEKQIRKHHPVTFAYKRMNIGGMEKCVFLYGKNNGGDFSNNRYNTPYHCSVICDSSDITRQPVLYCDSSIVCCDIPRSSILTEPDSNERPAILPSPASLDSESDTLDIPHFAGFMDITFSDICDFLKGGNRMSCFKSMVLALMKLKEGNEKYRIVIADKKENTIIWIAAISYLYSVENSLDISFNTYGYKLSDYDINGVYRADINNEPVDKSWPGEITEYDLAKISDNYAVYDFEEKYFAPEIEVENDTFMMLLERTFLNSDEEKLNGYKTYITTKTSFKGLDSQYKKGYHLYLFSELNQELDVNDLKEAIDFAKIYASDNEKYKIAEMVLNELPTNDSEIGSVYIDYINYATENSIISIQKINDKIINMIVESIVNLQTAKEQYDSLKLIADKVCKFSEGSMLAALTKKIGIDEVEKLIEKSDEWRGLVLMEAVCDSAQREQVDLEIGNTAYNSICLALYSTVDTVEKGEKIVGYMSHKIKTPVVQVMFLSAFYSAMSGRHAENIKKYIEETAVQKYFVYTNDNKSRYIRTIEQEKTDFSNHIVEGVIEKLKQMSDFKKKFFEIGQILDHYFDIFQSYSTLLELAVVSEIEEGKRLSSENIAAIYVILSEMEKRAATAITSEEISNIMNRLIEALYTEHSDLTISSKEKKVMKEVYCKYHIVQGNNVDRNIEIKAKVLFSIYELNKYVNSANADVYNTGSQKYQINLSEMEMKLKLAYIERVADLSLMYWENTGLYPKVYNMLYMTDEIKITDSYKILFEKMILNIIENKSEKDACEWIVKIIELSLSSDIIGIEKQLAEYLLYQSVKMTDITKLMEKDYEILKKNKTKQMSPLLSKVNGNYLMDTITYINHLSSTGKSKLSLKLQQLSVKNLFNKKDR